MIADNKIIKVTEKRIKFNRVLNFIAAHLSRFHSDDLKLHWVEYTTTCQILTLSRIESAILCIPQYDLLFLHTPRAILVMFRIAVVEFIIDEI